MERYGAALRTVGLFAGIAPDELTAMLGCLQAQVRHYPRGDCLLAAGDRPEALGILLSGRLHITKDDVDGNRALLAALEAGDMFGEALCSAGVDESPVTVTADSDADVLLLRAERILQTCPNSCRFHQVLVKNMVRLIARKNLYLQDRIELIRMKPVRAKVLGYLGGFVAKRGQPFQIPLNREEMADYLCVERSALSHELMRLKREGKIDYRKDTFTLL